MSGGVRRWLVATLLVGTPGVAAADGSGKPCTAGAAGVGDPYFPTYGNGGYDVGSYDLDITYDPATDRLDGEASIRAKATETLCSFHLDLVGLDVSPRRGRPPGRDLDARRPRAHRDAAATAARRPPVHGRSGLRRRAGDVRDPGLRPARWVHDHPRRCHRRRPARGGHRVVPGQRPSDRQGVVHLRRHRARRRRGRGRTASCAACAAKTGGRPGGGRPASRWPRTWRRSTSAPGT